MISIITPTYNEKENIRQLVDRIEKNTKEVTEPLELIIVDDCSPDGTWKIVQDLSKTKKFVKLLKREGKLGLTSAVLDGIKKSTGDKIIIMDADLSHPPEKLSEVIRNLKDYDLVVASRHVNGGGIKNWPLYRKILSSGATFLSKLILNIKCSDPMSGFFGVKRRLIQNTNFKTKGYKILLNILTDNSHTSFNEIPYVFEDRKFGKTKLGNQEIIAYLKDLYALKRGKK